MSRLCTYREHPHPGPCHYPSRGEAELEALDPPGPWRGERERWIPLRVANAEVERLLRLAPSLSSAVEEAEHRFSEVGRPAAEVPEALDGPRAGEVAARAEEGFEQLGLLFARHSRPANEIPAYQ